MPIKNIWYLEVSENYTYTVYTQVYTMYNVCIYMYLLLVFGVKDCLLALY